MLLIVDCVILIQASVTVTVVPRLVPTMVPFPLELLWTLTLSRFDHNFFSVHQQSTRIL